MNLAAIEIPIVFVDYDVILLLISQMCCFIYEKKVVMSIKNMASSVIRQKGESQNRCFRKTKHATSCTYVCVSGCKKCLFFGIFGVLCFPETPVLRFAFLLITDDVTNTETENILRERVSWLKANLKLIDAMLKWKNFSVTLFKMKVYLTLHEAGEKQKEILKKSWYCALKHLIVLTWTLVTGKYLSYEKIASIKMYSVKKLYLKVVF